MSSQTAAVLALFVDEPERHIYGREIVYETGIASGSLYPILHRLAQRGFLISKWEALEVATEAGRRPRLMYQLDPRGVEQASSALDASRKVRPRQSRPQLIRPAIP